LFDALPAEPALKLHTRLLPISRNKGNVRFPPIADIRASATLPDGRRFIRRLWRCW
jgi:hypothetical protein